MKTFIAVLLVLSSVAQATEIQIDNQYGQFSTRPDARQSFSLGPYTFSMSQSGSLNAHGQIFGHNLSTTTRNGRTEFQLNGGAIQVSPNHATVRIFGSDITFSK